MTNKSQSDNSQITIRSIVTSKYPGVRIHMMRGLPASGKSTYANILSEATDAAILNKDTLRKMTGLPFSKNLESAIKEAAKFIGVSLIKKGISIIIDDTNLPQKYEKYWTNIAEMHRVTLITYDFNVSVETCIKRDARRLNPVGEKVIRDLNMIRNPVTIKNETRIYAEQPNNKQRAIVVDIDGTVALMDGRSPYDATRYNEDKPNMPVIELIKVYQKSGYQIIFLSGRERTDTAFATTSEWLHTYVVDNYRLVMRKRGDHRPDQIVKKELYEEYIKGNYDVQFVLDDRDSVVTMWRNELQLPTFQVHWGSF